MLININKYCTNDGQTEKYQIDLNKVSIAEAIKALDNKHFDIEETNFTIKTNSSLRSVLKNMGMHIADLKREGQAI
tara:strand:+ start:104 stop:331 length:228 start_codon:yes stop_codon:yes gene_type:complete